jgi:hypothetical protein
VKHFSITIAPLRSLGGSLPGTKQKKRYTEFLKPFHVCCCQHGNNVKLFNVFFIFFINDRIIEQNVCGGSPGSVIPARPARRGVTRAPARVGSSMAVLDFQSYSIGTTLC